MTATQIISAFGRKYAETNIHISQNDATHQLVLHVLFFIYLLWFSRLKKHKYFTTYKLIIQLIQNIQNKTYSFSSLILFIIGIKSGTLCLLNPESFQHCDLCQLSLWHVTTQKITEEDLKQKSMKNPKNILTNDINVNYFKRKLVTCIVKVKSEY